LNDYNAFKAAYPDVATVQADSVIGRVGGKVLLTLQFEFGLMLACLRDTNNSQSVIDYFDMLERKFGFSRFQKMFPVILTDNGSEFSNPTAIETSPISGKQRTKVFYCDPNASWQKGNIENNHTNLRRILEKKTSFDNLNQADIDLVLSHLNSYIRRCYQDIPAITRFNSIFGYDILEQLHISLIDPDKVIMEPKLLRGKI
jgi:IS30 family transposase